MVERHPEINILYLVNPGDYSICQAIRKASTGRDIKIISNDLVEKQRQMVKDGVIAATICQEPENRERFRWSFSSITWRLAWNRRRNTILRS